MHRCTTRTDQAPDLAQKKIKKGGKRERRSPKRLEKSLSLPGEGTVRLIGGMSTNQLEPLARRAALAGKVEDNPTTQGEHTELSV